MQTRPDYNLPDCRGGHVLRARYLGRNCQPLGADCGESPYAGLEVALAYIELICCSVFAIDIVITCFYYPSALEYITSSYGIVDFASVMPIFFVLSVEFWLLGGIFISCVVISLTTDAFMVILLLSSYVISASDNLTLYRKFLRSQS